MKKKVVDPKKNQGLKKSTVGGSKKSENAKSSSGGKGDSREDTDKTQVFISMIDSKVRGTVSKEDEAFVTNLSEADKIFKEYSRYCRRQHNALSKQLTLQIKSQHAALVALNGTGFEFKAAEIDDMPFPLSRKIPVHTPPIKGFRAVDYQE